jgi:RimJ/RimL family protein N-acetyltransferase
MKLKKIILKGKRIILRPYSLKDAEQFSKLGETNRKGAINTIARAKNWIEHSWQEDSCYFGVFLKENEELIGNVELCHMNWWLDKAGEICCFIKKEYRHQGYGSESVKVLVDYCFKKLKFHKIYADTQPDNKAAQKNLEKLGFKFEGRIRDKNFVKGKWIDELDYGLLKREWKYDR